MDTRLILEKTYGCLAGVALGDAMGRPTEGWHYQAIRNKWGEVTGLVKKPDVDQSGRPKSPATTDDTQHLRVLAKTIIRKAGRIDAYDFAQGVLQYMNLAVMAETEVEIYKKICSGISAHELGLGQFKTPTPCFQPPRSGL